MKNIKIGKIISKIIKYIFCLFLITLALYNVIYVVGHELNPEFNIPFGSFSFYKVKDESMYPNIIKNDMIITSKVENLSKDDMVTFYENGYLKLRRIEKVNDNGYKRTYITKGDNYLYIDERELKLEDIQGKIIKKVNNAGILLGILQSKGLMVFNTIVLSLMFLYNRNLEKRRIRRRKRKNVTNIPKNNEYIILSNKKD